MFARIRDRVHRTALAIMSGLAAPVFATPALAEPAAPRVHDGPSPPAQAWRAAMESGDLAALARMHGPDTIAFPPGQTMLKGAGAIMKDYAGLFAKYTARVTFDEAHWVEQPPLVVSWGLYTLTLRPKGGGRTDVVTRGRFTDAATRLEGGWRYVVDHASTPKQGQ